MKKIAYVHDRLIFLGGADSLFFQLIKDEIKQTPKQTSKIFTLISKDKYLIIEGKKIQIITALPTPINNRFIYRSTEKSKFKSRYQIQLSRLFNYRNLLVFYPIVMKLLELKIKKFKPHKAIISSANISKNIKFPEQTYTKLYLHSPIMYVQPEFKKFYKNFNFPTRILLSIYGPILRYRDKRYKSFDEVRANSFHTARLAKKLYNIDASIAYPSIENFEIYKASTPNIFPSNYYIYVGRLVKNLRDVHKIIELFNKNGKKLIIVGDGADNEILKDMANKNIEFKGHISERKTLIKLVKNAKGYINIAYESSGMSTVEALSLGVPIFGYNKGGTAELVDKYSGYLVTKKDSDTINKGFEKFVNTRFDRFLIKQNIIKKIQKHSRKNIQNKN